MAEKHEPESDLKAPYPAWEKRIIILSAFGLVEFGAVVGVFSVYILFLKRRIEQHLQIQSVITSKVHEQQQIKGTEGSEKMKRGNFLQRLSSSSTSSSAKKSTQPKDTKKIVEEHHSVLIIPEKSTVPKAQLKTTDEVLPVIGPEAGGDKGNDEETQLQNFFVKIDLYLDGTLMDVQDAYEKLDANKAKLQHSAEFWWRFAKASHLQAEVAGKKQDKDLQKSLLQKAVFYGEKALKLNEKSADAHKWYAISLGSFGDFLKVSEKIQNGFIFKEHIDRAVILNPSDASLHHLLGRFCFEVSKLNWVERRMAAALFSAPTTATAKEALDHFLNAEKLGNPFIENRFYISKCYIELNDPKKTAFWLNSASQIPAVTSNDIMVQKSVTELLGKYRKYL